MKAALLTRQMARLRPAGKRHGRGVSTALGIYAGMCKAMRLDMRDIDRSGQGDQQESTKSNIVSQVRSMWADVAPAKNKEKTK
jgi:hypothetical protein